MKHGKSSFLPLLTLALATVASAAACGPSEEHPADASFDKATGEGRCTVQYDPGLVSPEQMVIAITDVGFTATPREPAAGDS